MTDTLGELIRERRLARGLSLGQLASAVGTTAGRVRRWERGEEVPEGADLAAVADYLDIESAIADELAPAEVADAATEDTTETELVEPDEPPEPDPEETAPESDDSPTELVSAAAGISLTSVSQPESPPEPAPDPTLDPVTEGPIIEEAPELAPVPAVQQAAVAVDPSPVAAPEAPLADDDVPVPRPVPLRYPESAPVGVAVEIAEPAPNRWNPLRYLYDPGKPWIYWLRAALTVLVLLVLVNILFDSVGELFDKLGEVLDTIEPSEPVDGEAPAEET